MQAEVRVQGADGSQHFETELAPGPKLQEHVLSCPAGEADNRQEEGREPHREERPGTFQEAQKGSERS